MYFDLPALERFYSTALGRASAASLNFAIRKLADFAPGSKVVSFGYVDPVAKAIEPAKLALSFVPARLGIGRTSAAPDIPKILSYLEALPLAKESVDTAILLHALEYSESPRNLLKELWRVLVPGGRCLLLVPDRFGLWCRSENSPFSQGEPYSKSQIRELLRDCHFTTLRDIGALHCPPLHRPVIGGLWRAMDRYGLGPPGVIAVMVEKREKALARATVKQLKPTFAPAASAGALS